MRIVDPSARAAVLPRARHLESIEPKSKADQEKNGHRAAAPFRRGSDVPHFLPDTETGQTIIAGMGELPPRDHSRPHVREFKVEADAGKPQIAYRESIHWKGRGRGQVQSGQVGRSVGQYGHCVAPVEPNVKGRVSRYVNEYVGGHSERIHQAHHRRHREAANNGVVAGYPVIGYQSFASSMFVPRGSISELASTWPEIFGPRTRCRKAKPIMLEPIMKVEVTVPRKISRR